MKHFFRIAPALACAALTLIACNKFQADPFEEEQQGQLCNINVTLGGAAVDIQTKATGEAASIATAEAKVNSLQVLVFRGDILDAYATVNNASTLSLSCTAGSRKIYAVVNAPDLSSVSSLSAFEAAAVDLSANTTSSFVMVGSKTVTLPGTKSVEIDVSRLVSRVVLKKISRNFTSPSLAALGFKVDKIYLVNAAGSFNYGQTAAPTKWYNLGENKSELPALLYDAPSATVANNSSYNTLHYFYAMPNPASSKVTKLVVEATLGTQKYYYPIALPAMEPNKSYEIAGVTIKRGGSENPDTPITSDDISFSVTVKNWVTSEISEQLI